MSKNILQEIHDRSIWQLIGAYTIGSWVVLQVAETVSSLIGLPLWFGRGVLFVLALGLPVLVATAIVQGRKATPAAAAAEGAPHAGSARRIFTWRHAIGGGVAAFAALGMLTVGYLATRALGIGPAGSLVARGVLAERATIVLADFEAPDESLGRAMTESFRVDLSQSDIVRLADPAALSAALGRMERPADAPLDLETAREIAQRDGYPAVVVGTVDPVGEGYVLTAQLLSAVSGEVLASQRENAKDDEQLIDAIDRLASRLRERIGESLRAIQTEAPLSEVTTSNLDALKLYSQASELINRRADVVQGLALLDQAVALDTGFATAWIQMSVTLGNLGIERAKSVDAIERAMRHSDRLPAGERARVAAFYHTHVTGDWAAAAAAYENILAADPDHASALANLSDIYIYLRDFDRAIEYAQRAIAADSAVGVSWWNLAEAQARLGRFDEARATWDRSIYVVGPEFPFILSFYGQLEAAEGDYEAADSLFRRIADAHSEDGFWAWAVPMDLAASAAVRGHLEEARLQLGRAIAVDETQGSRAEALRKSIWLALIEARLGNDERSAATVAQALDRYDVGSLAPIDRPYLELVVLYAELGDAAAAHAAMNAFEAELPEFGATPPIQNYQMNHGSEDRSRGYLALVEGRYEDAIADFRRSDVSHCRPCALPGLAAAYDSAGMADSAIAVYSRFVDLPEPFGLWFGDPFYRATTLERLGELYDEQGDAENAALYYARFVELWETADPLVQQRIEAARGRLEAIVRERG